MALGGPNTGPPRRPPGGGAGLFIMAQGSGGQEPVSLI